MHIYTLIYTCIFKEQLIDPYDNLPTQPKWLQLALLNYDNNWIGWQLLSIFTTNYLLY